MFMQWWSMRCLYKTFVKRLVSYNDTSQVKTCKWLFREHYPSGGKYYPWGRNFAVKWPLGSKDILIVAWKINFGNREERTFVQRQETQQNPLWDQARNKRERNPLSYFCLVQIFERLLVEKYTECSLRWKMKCWWTINNNNECLLFNSSLLFLDFMGLWGSMPNDFISDSKINQIVRSQIYLEES